MKLHNLKPASGAVKKGKRVGRGQGSGRGGTSTRGHNGAQSRSGYSRKEGFEGGQMPIQRRLPKFGFTNPNRVESRGINLDDIQAIAEAKGVSVIDVAFFIENGLASKKDRIKILARGEFSSKLEITAHAFSGTALASIEKAGGKAATVEA